VDALLALAGFSIVSAVTPGPNNILLWASGATFGFRATVRHMLGSAVGIGGMALVLAAGLGALFTLVPELEVGMKVAASAYLLFLAGQVAGAHALQRGQLGHPLSVRQAAAFQVINPKAWIFALGAITTFRPPGLPPVAGSLLVVLVMVMVIVPAAALWAGAGEALGRLLTNDRRGRVVSLALALIIAATVVYVWI
jgi:threonine/homoserine/homoserine lactone efflux protein